MENWLIHYSYVLEDIRMPAEGSECQPRDMRSIFILEILVFTRIYSYRLSMHKHRERHPLASEIEAFNNRGQL